MTTATLALPREVTSASAAVGKPRLPPGRTLTASLALALTVQPTLLPHPWWAQVVAGAGAAVNAYAVMAFLGFLVGKLTGRVRAFPHPAAGLLVAALAPLVAVLVALPGAADVAGSAGTTPPTLAFALATTVGAALVAAAVVLLARGVRRLAGTARRHPRGVLVLALTPLLALGLASPAAAETVPGATDAASLTSALGHHGQQLLDAPSWDGVPTTTAPVRVYVGKTAAPSPQERADLAVRELERDGGLSRQAVLLMLPTGSGWVNTRAATAVEKLYDGDVATVAVQYASVPSWVAYLSGGDGADVTARTLTDAVRARLDRLPAAHRPTLLVYGESLGAWGALRAYPDAGITSRADATLFAGVPGGLPTGAASTLIHPDDPVPAWTPRLAVAPSSQWHHRWLPLISFWQATADVLSSQTVPDGHGHSYGAELLPAWQHTLR